MRDLIPPRLSPDLRLAAIGTGASELLQKLGTSPSDLDQADGVLFLVSAITGVSAEENEQWTLARELYIPSIVVVTELEESDSDFDDMIPIVGRLLDPVITPYLVLHSESGSPVALIDLDTLEIREKLEGRWIARESDAEHKILVFDFRKEYLEAIDAAGSEAFENGLAFPALPYIPSSGLGLTEIISILATLPIRS